MNVQERKDLLVQIGNYMTGQDEQWQHAKLKAQAENHWFIQEFIELSIQSIATSYLNAGQLQKLIDQYKIPMENAHPQKVGIVMAGNIPLAGFHDLLCVFLTGHKAIIKPSSKDEVLIKHLIKKMVELEPPVADKIMVQEIIKNCDAYITTGSNNSSRYFEYYFQKYPSIIRKNRTSVAILTGEETIEELLKLADDVFQYFGLGSRNVTQIYVPENYDFIPLLSAFRKYEYLSNHHKYKNNYDYNLAIHILNKQYYMSNENVLIIENSSPFSPIGQLNYQSYSDFHQLHEQLRQNDMIQYIVSKKDIPFGEAHCPAITSYADGVDTITFLMNL
ncbi:MAG TPA: acyl-CoA reductase [Flavisolibacter sp.]|nr:acyl-CoA reductase [Flavisolibacter sp.]